MHLAVFGGTFDPPHNGHLALCLFARELLEIDKLIISVSNNPFKQNRGAADEHRKRMAECLSREINFTGSCSQVSGWELEKRQPSYTVDLIKYVRQLYPHDRVTLLVGEDSFREIHSWKDYEKLFSLCDIVVFSRTSTEVEAPPHDSLRRNGSIAVIDFAYEVSSTEIRELVAAGQSIARLVPPEVNRYILEHGLYLQP
ncbi:MAG: nicotinate (nicotinamide) nucleotide adenylyltransferase [Chlorobiaceae bacterium]